MYIEGFVLPSLERVYLDTDGGVIRHLDSPAPSTTQGLRGVYIAPALCDLHCHIGLGPNGPVSLETAEEQAVTDRDAGVLLVRDAGVPMDTRWLDRNSQMPKIIRAGRHIARPKRYFRYYANEIEPEQLVDEVARQSVAGDGWVKLVGDWIDREVGDLGSLWPADIAAEAIAKAHELGARVTAHCFAEESVHDLVRAGIDCIEHGTGLDDSTIELMADHGVGLVPTMCQLENFPTFAQQGETKFPTYAAHMRDLHSRRVETIGKAKDAGVRIYAGTDAGGIRKHGTIAEELELLSQIGGPEFALEAASWGAREFLRAGQLCDGDPADMVIYHSNPLDDAKAVGRPDVVVLNGVVVKR